jgi:hypothetical protein
MLGTKMARPHLKRVRALKGLYILAQGSALVVLHIFHATF